MRFCGLLLRSRKHSSFSLAITWHVNRRHKRLLSLNVFSLCIPFKLQFFKPWTDQREELTMLAEIQGKKYLKLLEHFFSRLNYNDYGDPGGVGSLCLEIVFLKILKHFWPDMSRDSRSSRWSSTVWWARQSLWPVAVQVLAAPGLRQARHEWLCDRKQPSSQLARRSYTYPFCHPSILLKVYLFSHPKSS